ncbi:dihydropteroate synthase [Candidatus Endolissoclinum faulkneri L2]|uniref:dihydropteroate synthase n=1 Tax=Candidatus Endolissoclinum faulkneri L2 TaxID=1193729 RepID=K7YMG3_9PROT|nr:dihydropteroate synthase [Candidatus Endolissoclinum faulkneri]AFX98712.1 dihydropteroate synthase [Candidatus Endolissoclinum faulkneri L2]
MNFPIIREPSPGRGCSLSAIINPEYARPIDLLYGPMAKTAVDSGDALLLAGGPIAFRALQLICREANGLRVQNVNVPELDSAFLPLGMLECFTKPRSPILNNAIPAIMGIINVTPDSFFDGGRFAARDKAISRGRQLAAAGADILDIGGESTRPGSTEVTVAEEIDRVVPVIEALAVEKYRISIDTRKASVMYAALEAGAEVVNDVSGLMYDSNARELLANNNCPIVLMHMRGTHETMHINSHYSCAPIEVYDELSERLAVAERAGIALERLIIDPGFGFSKSVSHNVLITAWLTMFHGMGRPILFGGSRKSSIGALSRNEPVDARLPGSIALALSAFELGVQAVRVHDVSETAQAFAVRRAIINSS